MNGRIYERERNQCNATQLSSANTTATHFRRQCECFHFVAVFFRALLQKPLADSFLVDCLIVKRRFAQILAATTSMRGGSG